MENIFSPLKRCGFYSPAATVVAGCAATQYVRIVEPIEDQAAYLRIAEGLGRRGGLLDDHPATGARTEKIRNMNPSPDWLAVAKPNSNSSLRV
jgi:hypothetical protein